MIESTPPHILNKINLSGFNLPEINAYTPSPADFDYSTGKIKRFFVGRPNYYSIVEVSGQDYQYFYRPFFIPVKLSWKISGRKNSVYINNILDEVGVYEYNLQEINIAKKTLPDLDIFLKNPLQFWRGF